jgi:hypothetical protein
VDIASTKKSLWVGPAFSLFLFVQTVSGEEIDVSYASLTTAG